MDHDDKKMSKSDYDAYLSFALSSSRDASMVEAYEQGYYAFEETKKNY